MLETVARELGSLLKSKVDELERNSVFYNAFLWRKQFTTTTEGLYYIMIVCDWKDRVILEILRSVKKFVNKHCKILYLMLFILYMYTCMYVYTYIQNFVLILCFLHDS